MLPSGLKPGAGPGLALMPSGQSSNTRPMFWPSSGSKSKRGEEIWTNLMRERVTSFGSERRNYAIR